MGINAVDYRTFVNEARKFVGTPFHWGARVQGGGIDCAGLVICAAQNAGFEFEDKIEYKQRAKKIIMRGFLDALNEVEAWLPVTDGLQGGDILSFIVYKGRIRHLGIYTFDDTVIHAHTDANKVVEQPYEALKSLVHSAFRLKPKRH